MLLNHIENTYEKLILYLVNDTCFNKFWKTGIIFNSRLFSDITN